MHTTIPKRRPERHNSDPDLPPDLDPEAHPIIARHFYGLDLQVVREVYWNQVRLGHRLPTQSGVIVFDRGQR